MTEIEKAVWQAIEDALHEVGDEDIKAGLAWISPEGKKLVAQKAIIATGISQDEIAVLSGNGKGD